MTQGVSRGIAEKNPIFEQKVKRIIEEVLNCITVGIHKEIAEVEGYG